MLKCLNQIVNFKYTYFGTDCAQKLSLLSHPIEDQNAEQLSSMEDALKDWALAAR